MLIDKKELNPNIKQLEEVKGHANEINPDKAKLQEKAAVNPSKWSQIEMDFDRIAEKNESKNQLVLGLKAEPAKGQSLTRGKRQRH